ncbi:tRNA(Phe) 7-((3-amino-3-carboxypropyl)-4-demethyl wyosine(37)-N(4))-methyltransferase 1 [uncultured archaeon]|nr:tRNA(Phe) 7-((3-amino-3-carboxypropyl)-4-demethyl wyosine(37)-N(4))-methyltransferase 1 [uncultured archaeon]
MSPNERKTQNGEKKRCLEEKSRFEMTKKHHSKTYKEAKALGRMDEDFIPLCDYVEKTKNYFTSSSCAGRIALIGLGEEESKQESAFYRKWHRKVSVKEVLEAIKSFSGDVLWFKQEPLILHIGTNTIENAKNLLILCEKAGIKRAGIKVAKDGKFIVEMLGTQNINAPIKEGKVCAGEDYLKYLIKKGNEKFEKNQELIKKLTKEAKKFLNRN